MTATEPPEPRHTVVLVHGPSSVTKSAVKRLKRVLGGAATISLVAAAPDAEPVVRRLAGPDVGAAPGSGRTALDRRLESYGDGQVLLVHDDVSVDEGALTELSRVARRTGVPAGPLVPKTDRAAGYCLVGRPLDLVALPLILGDSAPTLSPALAVGVASQVRHDERCAPAKLSARPLVTASLIVRDEEHMLGECLASLDGFADRVVVCDTGSVDRTMEIARTSGAEVVSWRWEDDFAAARNVALDHARDSTWVLWIDADERLVCVDPVAARHALAAAEGAPESWLLEVESTRSNGPTSIGTAQRLFRPAGLGFVGAIHEELRRFDGGVPLHRRLPHVRIAHLGYDHTLCDLAAKASRNVAIAHRAHAMAPTTKTALDLARSLAFDGRSLEELQSVLETGLGLADASDPIRAELLALKARQELQLDQTEKAFASARGALDQAPGNDVAAAVFAKSAVALGRDADLVEVMARPRGGDGIRVPQNRAVALAHAAGAAARLADDDRAAAWLGSAHDLLGGAEDRWMTLLDALGDVAPEAARRAVDRLEYVDEQAVHSAALRLWGADRARALRPRSAEEHPLATGGITFSFGALRLPVPDEILAAWIPPGRRILDWTGNPQLTERLRKRAAELDTVGADDLPDTLHAMAAAGGRVDVAVGGVAPRDVPSLLPLLRAVLDPAGMLAIWEVDEAGNIPAATGAADRGRIDPALLTGHGFMPEAPAPGDVIAARPTWDAGTFTAPRVAATSTVWVASPEPLPDQMRLAYRASIPGNQEVEFVPERRLTELPAADPVLVTDAHVMPDPRWIQAALDAFAAERGPVGIRLIDRAGTVVQAGATPDGRMIGAGEDAAAPIVQSDLRDVRLRTPFVAAAGTLTRDSDVGGRLLAAPVAVALSPHQPVGRGVAITEMYGDTALFLGGPAPGREHPEESAALDKIFDRLLEAGITPVYQWEPGQSPDPYVLHRWRRRGVVVFDPSPMRTRLDQFSPDPQRPRADALVVAFAPLAIIYMSDASLDWDFQSIAGRAGTACSYYTGVMNAKQFGSRVDRACPLPQLADELVDATQRMADGRSPVIPSFAAVDHVAGLVSIVIPVFNRWDLTAACLDSIKRHTSGPYEVIVIDNGSTDETAAGLQGAAVTVVTNDENRGFPAAVNQGIAQARGEYVCLLNNDTEVTEGWLEALLSAVAIPGTGVVGPRSNQIAGLQRVADAPRLADRTDALQWASDWKATAGSRTWRTTRLIGFCMLARRATFEEVGGFDEGFGIGNFEDDDFGRRVMETGRTLRVADGSVVLHHGSATFQALDLDYAAIMHQAARHRAVGPSEAGAAAATVVLSDSNPAGAASCAATALRITDRVRIVERGAVAATELAAAAVRGGTVEVVGADWADDAGAQGAVADITEPFVLVVGSNERIEGEDWGQARAEIESFSERPVEIRAPGGSEVRLVPSGDGLVGAIGTQSSVRARTFWLVPGDGGAA